MFDFDFEAFFAAFADLLEGFWTELVAFFGEWFGGEE